MQDAREDELGRELQEAYQRYVHASPAELPAAREVYLAKLAAFSAHVLGKTYRVRSCGG